MSLIFPQSTLTVLRHLPHLNACISIFRQSEKSLTFSRLTAMKTFLVLWQSVHPAAQRAMDFIPTHPRRLVYEARYTARNAHPWMTEPSGCSQDDTLSGQH